MGAHWVLRARVLIADYAAVLAVALLVLGLFGSAVVYSTHVAAGTETEQEVVGVWESTGEFSHEASVTEQNRVFSTGTVLQDRSLYYTRLSPELDGEFTYRFEAPTGEVTADVETMLVLSATDDEELWRTEETLDSDSTTLSPGETATTTFTVNVTEIIAEIDAIEADLGASVGEIDPRIRTDVTVGGTAGGEAVSNQERYELSVSPGSSTYGVQNPGPQTARHEHVEPTSVERTYSPLRRAGGPLLLLLGLFGLGALTIAWHRESLQVTEMDRRTLGFERERNEYDDWISRGSVSDAVDDRSMVHIDELEDLVDIAIDTDERVIEDIDSRRYYVLGESYCYEYMPPQGIALQN